MIERSPATGYRSRFRPSGMPSYGAALPQADELTQTGSTVEAERNSTNWRLQEARNAVARSLLSSSQPAPTPQTAACFAAWIMECPSQLARPDVSVGDDGTLVVEWNIGQRHFHVSFIDDESEGYYFDDSGRKESIEDLGAHPNQVNAIFSRMIIGRRY